MTIDEHKTEQDGADTINYPNPPRNMNGATGDDDIHRYHHHHHHDDGSHNQNHDHHDHHHHRHDEFQTDDGTSKRDRGAWRPSSSNSNSNNDDDDDDDDSRNRKKARVGQDDIHHNNVALGESAPEIGNPSIVPPHGILPDGTIVTTDAAESIPGGVAALTAAAGVPSPTTDSMHHLYPTGREQHLHGHHSHDGHHPHHPHHHHQSYHSHHNHHPDVEELHEEIEGVVVSALANAHTFDISNNSNSNINSNINININGEGEGEGEGGDSDSGSGEQDGSTTKKMSWKARNEQSWQHRFHNLKLFKERTGHCRVPKRWSQDCKLGHWTNKQRNDIGPTKMKEKYPERYKLLDSIGFWEVKSKKDDETERWNEKFQELKAFKEKNGHLRVPKRYPENPTLGRWCHKQRMYEDKWKNEKPERYDSLDKLGYWSYKNDVKSKEEDYWQVRFEALKAFHEENGHFEVKTRFRDVNQFARWVSTQIKNRSRMKTSDPERYASLSSIGFWEAFPDRSDGDSHVDKKAEGKEGKEKLEATTEHNEQQPVTTDALRQPKLELPDGPDAHMTADPIQKDHTEFHGVEV